MDRIFLSPPDMSGAELKMVSDAFASNWIAPLGPFVDKFEQGISDLMQGRPVCALASGTSALHLSMLTLDVGPGDTVYCSDFTFSASCNVIRYCGAQPVLIDSDYSTWQMDPDILAETLERDAKAGKLPKAVIVVDLYGIPANFDRIIPICRQYGVPIVEDSAEALGSKLHGKPCGTFGKTAAFSFNGNKIITTSGGGAFVSDDPILVRRARFLATQAREQRPYYHHETIGYNYRLSNILAALGCAQLGVLDRHFKRRREIFHTYQTELADIEGLSWMPEPDGTEMNCWLSVATLDPAIVRKTPNEIRLALEDHNIESRLAWKPMHMQPVFGQCRREGGQVGERIFERALCLPSGSSLSHNDQARVISQLRKIIAAGR